MSNRDAQEYSGFSGADALEKQLSTAASIERCAALTLKNRFFWLAAGCSWFLSAQLNYAQYRWQRFDTFELISHLLVVLEAGLLACAVISALGLQRLGEAWRGRWPAQPFSFAAAGLGGMLALLGPFAVHMGLLITLHGYPELASQGVQIPLLLLQRGTLLLYAVLLTYNVVLALRYTLRLPAWACALAGIGWHWGFAYWVTMASFKGEALRRLNDLFYVNQLWRYSDSIPKLSRPEIVYNIQYQYGGFLAAGILLVAATTLLWLPAAMKARLR